MLTSYLLAVLAGVLSVLSPCVLPLLPLVFGAAASAHRLGPLALACGLVVSYVAIGLFLATIGFEIGLDGEVVRKVAAFALLLVGAFLLIPAAQTRLAVVAGPMVDRMSGTIDRWSPRSVAGQFGVGVLLGAMWSPCVGPTLGAASALAAQGKDLGSVALTMCLFGLGAALPLLLVGMAGRQVLARWRDRLMSAGKAGKATLGVALVLAGLLVLTGLDRKLETIIVNASPDWLSRLTSSF